MSTRTRRTKPRLAFVSKVPTDDQILSIPLARSGEYELSDKETQRTRRRIYSINRDNAAGWRFRTLREGRYLLVWRIH